ncbi:hypothetical protein FHW20_002218 [Ochrobactrum intermedium]|uniref:Secreted protein n=1 Tax=Brucella intermedia TaxID=94625 RepID=A0ABR6APG7_9HYPH|nr:hypothetical protein [Brucella intermedia]NYD83498.1 hypothetical protein [Brucella intermedia]HCH72881.1 hypothetical protein [Ochrobactrum sp.]
MGIACFDWTIGLLHLDVYAGLLPVATGLPFAVLFAPAPTFPLPGTLLRSARFFLRFPNRPTYPVVLGPISSPCLPFLKQQLHSS